MPKDGLAFVSLDRDEPAIEHVLASAVPQHRHLDDWIGEADAILGAVISDRVVGIAARYHAPLHPERDWLTIHVEPLHRRAGIGSELHQSLTTAAAARPTKVRIPSTEKAGLLFAAAHGYSRLVSSAEIVVHNVDTPVTAADLEIVEVATDDASFLDALGRLYVASDRWDPCPRLPARDVRRFLAGDDALPDTARIARRRGEVVGVGVAYEGRTPDRIEMANFGAVDPEAADGVAITHAVLHAVSHRLLDAGATAIVECDFGEGANTALGDLLVRLVGAPSATVEILATSTRRR